MKVSVKILSLLLVVVGITFSCTKAPAYIDDISLYDLRSMTLIDDIEIYQQGIAILINSEDFKSGSTYTVSVANSESDLHWEVQTTPIVISGQTFLYVNDILMNANLTLPSGEYTIDVLQEDASFLYSKVLYQRKVINEKVPPIHVTWSSESSTFSFDAQEEYLYDLRFYDANGTLIEHLQNRSGEIEIDKSQQRNLKKVVILGYQEGSSTINVYRIIL